jgi:hypothetical protein
MEIWYPKTNKGWSQAKRKKYKIIAKLRNIPSPFQVISYPSSIEIVLSYLAYSPSFLNRKTAVAAPLLQLRGF